MNGGIFSKGINKKEQRYRYELYCMSYTTQLSIKIGVNKKTSKKKLTMGIAPCYKYSFQYPLLFISQQMCVYFSWMLGLSRKVAAAARAPLASYLGLMDCLTTMMTLFHISTSFSLLMNSACLTTLASVRTYRVGQEIIRVTLVKKTHLR